MSVPRCLAWIAILAFTAGGVEPTDPIELDLKEQVAVQLVLFDVVVIDRAGRTVTGLSAADFEVRVGGKWIEVATADEHCPSGPLRDPTARNKQEILGGVVEASSRRRLVLVFDYYHMESPALALESARRTIRELQVGGGEHMVVSLGQVVRIESPFTADLGETARVLERMRNDIALYGAAYDRFTEHGFFERMTILFDVLEQLPGQKTAILYSGPFLQDGFYHDPDFERLAAQSARARAAVYTVDTGGLGTPFDPPGLGGPAMLRRIANETGGRATADTNDLGVGYARAVRDLSCSYTLAFHDKDPRFDRERRVSIYVRRPGYRVLHPAQYERRSGAAEREALMTSAAMAPEIFDGGGVAVDLRPLGRQASRRRDVLVRIDISPSLMEPAPPGAEWELRAELRRLNGTLVHRFERRFVEPEEGLEILEPTVVAPGTYVATVVLSHPGSSTPRAARATVELP